MAECETKQEEEESIFSDFQRQKEERDRRIKSSDNRLHQAVLEQDADLVRCLLKELSSDEVNARDRKGNPALHLATHLQNEEIIRLLVEAGADISWKNGGGWWKLDYRYIYIYLGADRW